MDVDRRELVRRLCVLATEIAEAAHEAATAGQASAMPAGGLVRTAGALERHGGDLQAIARAIAVALRGDAAGASLEELS